MMALLALPPTPCSVAPLHYLPSSPFTLEVQDFDFAAPTPPSDGTHNGTGDPLSESFDAEPPAFAEFAFFYLGSARPTICNANSTTSRFALRAGRIGVWTIHAGAWTERGVGR